ncbi:MAG TPA: DUF433 domain-containing protein [Bacteroidia bacterium]|nr:DUF433 domain-containing protein [Bacteroidia bacterium]
MKSVRSVITIDKDVLGGQPVFKNTRVPVESLFMHLEKGITVEEFLNDFPTVSKEQVIAVLEIAGKIVTSKDIEKFYETIA